MRAAPRVRYSHHMAADAPALVAVVDDEEAVRTTVGLALERAGYRIALHPDGAAAWQSFERSLPDLVVLDIMMPRMDGLELCRRLRALSPAIPIIMLSSRDEELDRVLGLELGADDYLCKPFSLRELVARVRVLLRRVALAASPSKPERLVTVSAMVLDLDRFMASWRGVSLALTVTEFRLLDVLARRPGHVKTRRQLLDAAYPDDAWAGERAIDTHIKRLRRKLEAIDPEFHAVETVHGLGYRWRVSGG